jgi:Family of unknown function (DUF5670)
LHAAASHVPHRGARVACSRFFPHNSQCIEFTFTEHRTLASSRSCVKVCVRKEKDFTTLACCVLLSVQTGGDEMLWTIFVILMILWLLGMVSSYTLGGFIHLLLLIALVVLLINLITGRRPAL